jgi:phage terminase small subunit
MEGEHIPAKVDPLTYMLQVMNNPLAENERRDRMAIAAAPFVHGKVGEAGKKQARADAARAAGGGRFAPAPPPPRSPGRVN